MTDYTSGTGLDPHFGQSRVEAVSHRTPRMPWTRPARPNAEQRTQTVLRRRCSAPMLSYWPLSNWRRSVAPSQNDRTRNRVLLLRTIDPLLIKFVTSRDRAPLEHRKCALAKVLSRKRDVRFAEGGGK
jgi:hypothetical protein